MKLIFTTALSILSIAAFAQTAPDIQWQKSFGGKNYDGATSIQQTTDGGYIIAGYTASNNGEVTGNHGSYDYWIIKLNEHGKMQWQKCLGGSGYDYAYSIQQTTDSGYIVAGTSESKDGDITAHHRYEDAWIVKLNKRGNIQWQSNFGGRSNEAAYCIQQTADSGYVFAGYTYSTDGDVSGNHGSVDAWIVKLNNNGKMQWQKCLGGSNYDYAHSIRQTADGGYIVAGNSGSNDGDVSGNHGLSDAWIVKLNKNGNMQWQKSLGGKAFDYALSIQQTTDSGFIAAGHSNSNNGDVNHNHGSNDYWIVKLNKNGKLQWQKSLGGSFDDNATAVMQTKDSGYIIAGFSNSQDGDVTNNHGADDYWVVKLNQHGKMQWQKSFGGTNDDYPNAIQQAKDGGYVIAGTSLSNDGDKGYSRGVTDCWIVKLFADSSIVPLANLPADANATVNSDVNVRLFPNPVKDRLHIEGLSTFIKTISVIDVNGKLLQQFVTSNSDYSFSTTQLNAGTYFIRITENDKTKLLQFVKQ